MISRSEALAQLTERKWDLLVIGGGIVGAGIARDAALRGLAVALVERRDIASGTSSKSSRLLHGGLRYLAQGRVGLVREASAEKRVIGRIAPHISEPLPFLFPTHSTPLWGQWPLWKLMAGVKIYDLLCPGSNFGKSSWLGPKGMLERLPGVRRERLTGGVRYFDGLTNDSRLVTDTIRSAAAAGAAIVNYCEAAEPRTSADGWVCDFADSVRASTGSIAARAVANCTGPWAQGFGPSQVRLRLTKGVHLVIDREKLPVPDAVVMTEGSRILFAIPWNQRVILGTTDTDYDGPLDNIETDEEDLQYVLGVVGGAFPDADLSPADVISDWAGVRPLIANPGGGPSDISRSHEIRSPQPGWWDIAGGKLTTYRLMAEQTVDQVVKYLGTESKPCQTATTPLLPDADVIGISQISPPEPSQELVRHFITSEWALSLEDVMLRRGGWRYYCPDSSDIARKVGEWMAAELGWDASRLASELEAYPKTISTGANA